VGGGSVADLNQLNGPVGLADVLELVSVPATGTEEIATKVVNSRLDLGELPVSSAAFASPHDEPPLKEGIVA
jgi:hypothetical protein